MTDFKQRFIGFCPICEGDFKLQDNRLVHHGYRRPGHGYIVGDCLSVHKAPYELSDEVCRLYKMYCTNALESNREHLARLQSGQVKQFQVPDYSKGYLRHPEMMEITVVHRAFHQAWESEIHLTESHIKGLLLEINRMDRYIADWALKPIRTFEEEMEAKRAVVQKNKAEREAKRQIKREKAAALKAKYAAWEEEKAQLMAKFKARFLELAAIEPFDPNTVGLEARQAYGEMQKAASKKGYLYFYARDLQIDQAFIRLRLATVRDDGWVQYAY